MDKLKEHLRENWYKLHDFKVSTQVLTNRLEELTAQLNQSQDELNLLRAKVEEREKELSGTGLLTNQRSQREGKLNVLMAKVAELENLLGGVDELAPQLGKKDEQIAILQGRVSDLERELVEKEKELQEDVETEKALKSKIKSMEEIMLDLTEGQKVGQFELEHAVVENSAFVDVPTLTDSLVIPDLAQLETDRLSVASSDQSFPQLSLCQPAGSKSLKRSNFDIYSANSSDVERSKKKKPELTSNVVQSMSELEAVETGHDIANKRNAQSVSPRKANNDVHSCQVATRWSNRLAKRQKKTVKQPQATAKKLAKVKPKCYMCGELWKNGKVLRDHLEADHGYQDDNEAYGWCHCGTGFKTVTAVKNHQLFFDH